VYRSQTQINPGARGGLAALVIAGHIAVIYAIAVSLGIVETPVIEKPLEAVIIDTQIEEPESPPETPKVAKSEPTVDVPPPEIPVLQPPAETAISIPPAPPAVVEPSPGPAMSESKSLEVTRRVDPIYPPASRRMNEEGAVRLRVLIDERGRPQEVKVAKSSGFPRLDEAAVTAVKRWVFAPAMQGGAAVSTWTQVSVVFQLTQ
jgi:periplasmic protein TonB